MKRLIAVALLLLFIIGVNIISFCVTDKYYLQMEQRLDECIEEYKSGDKKTAAVMAAELEDFWHDSEAVLILFLNRYSIDDIAETATRLVSFAQSEDDAMFFCEGSLCLHLLEDLKRSDRYLVY